SADPAVPGADAGCLSRRRDRTGGAGAQPAGRRFARPPRFALGEEEMNTSPRVRCHPGLDPASMSARPGGCRIESGMTSRWGCAYREETWWGRDRRVLTMSLQRRVRAGRGASLRGAWVCLISWPRACALRKLTRRTCLNGAALGRVVSCATGHEIKQTQGSRCEAPTALPMRRGLPGHDFAACLRRPARHDGCRIESGMTIQGAEPTVGRAIVAFTLRHCQLLTLAARRSR